jgi:hypothetical protein
VAFARRDFVGEVAEQRDQRALALGTAELAHAAEIAGRCVANFGGGQRFDHVAQLGEAGAWREPDAGLGVEGEQADAFAALQRDGGEVEQRRHREVELAKAVDEGRP